MKNSFLHPFLLPLAAVLSCSPHVRAEGTPPPQPDAPAHADLHLQKSDDNDADDEPEDAQKYRSYEQGYKELKKQKVTFLGVNTSPLPEPVAAQLPLEKGTGLLVTYVAKDSPAARAGLAANDVLTKLDEHVLVNSAQLQTLIENRKEGDAATLTYYRQGQSKSAAVSLATQEKAVGSHGWTFSYDWNDPARTAEFQAAMAKAQSDVQRALAEARQATDRAHGEVEKQKGELAAEMATLKRALKGVDLPSKEMMTTFGRPGSTQTMTMDEEGMFLLTRRDGRVRLRAMDRTGKVLFEGDVTRPEDQAAVPASLSGKLQKMLHDLPAEPETVIPPVPPVPAVPPEPAVPPVPPVPPVPKVPSAPAAPAAPAIPGASTAP